MSGTSLPATPSAAGYHMPAEWEPHSATWIAWPHEPQDWPGKFALIPWTYAEIVRRLSQDEHVEILTQNNSHTRSARRVLARSHVALDRVRFHVRPTDRSWVRDSGPTFVRRTTADSSALPSVALVHWKFNGWAKYDNWHLDRAVPPWMARRLRLPIWRARSGRRWVVCEGGAIDVNGEGLLICTEECLLGEVQGRNPGLGRKAIEQTFRRYLGTKQVLWLDRGISGDDTHGHVDDLARFVGPQTILAVTSHDPADPDFDVLRTNRQRLDSFRSESGSRLRILELPTPRPVLFAGQRLPASYANFYIANRTVLVPTFDDPNDSVAVEIIRSCFPGREVVGIRSRDLVWGLGTLHCLTQQQPLPDEG